MVMTTRFIYEYLMQYNRTPFLFKYNSSGKKRTFITMVIGIQNIQFQLSIQSSSK